MEPFSGSSSRARSSGMMAAWLLPVSSSLLPSWKRVYASPPPSRGSPGAVLEPAMVPDFLPFPGVRYRPEAAAARLEELTAPPYDVIDAEARARLEAAHPMNAVHLILPRDQEPGDRYQRAALRLQEWQREGVLEADPPRLYRYRMAFTDDGGRARVTTGVVGALALSPPGQ